MSADLCEKTLFCFTIPRSFIGLDNKMRKESHMSVLKSVNTNRKIRPWYCKQ